MEIKTNFIESKINVKVYTVKYKSYKINVQWVINGKV